jgi:hypothetical protein
MGPPLKTEAKKATALVISVVVGLISWPILACGIPALWLSSGAAGDLAGDALVILVCMPLAGTGIPSLVIGLITYAILMNAWAKSEDAQRHYDNQP